MCGEKTPRTGACIACTGSPPRVRGKAHFVLLATTLHRITPACAGKSNTEAGVQERYRDHPRVCGEKKSKNSGFVPAQGSPPRVRGKVVAFIVAPAFDRITPACAGKSRPHVPSWRRSGDHPRVCGEKLFTTALYNCMLGSPPRVRGKDADPVVEWAVQGITPACAGKRFQRNSQFEVWKDHPRVCGEKTKKIPSHRPFQLHPVPVSFSFA